MTEEQNQLSIFKWWNNTTYLIGFFLYLNDLKYLSSTWFIVSSVQVLAISIGDKFSDIKSYFFHPNSVISNLGCQNVSMSELRKYRFKHNMISSSVILGSNLIQSGFWTHQLNTNIEYHDKVIILMSMVKKAKLKFLGPGLRITR